MKGWRDHTFTGIITFLIIGATAASAVFKYVIIPLKVGSLEEENSRLLISNKDYQNQISSLKKGLSSNITIREYSCDKEQGIISSKQETIEKQNNKLVALIDKVDLLQKNLNSCGTKNHENAENKHKEKTTSNKTKVSTVGPYTFVLKKCEYKAANILCDFTVAHESGGEAYFHRKSHKGASILYMPNSTPKAAYKLNIGSVGGTKERFGVRLPPGVPVSGSIEFRGVDNENIQLLEIGISRTVLHNPEYVRFPDIDVIEG